MPDWGFLTNHARVLVCIAHEPGARLRDIAASLGITERSARGIITDLAEAGYVVKQKDGRRNRYQIEAHLPLPEPGTREPAVGEVPRRPAGEHGWPCRADGPCCRGPDRRWSGGRHGCDHRPGRWSRCPPAAWRMTAGAAWTGPRAIFFPANMATPGL